MPNKRLPGPGGFTLIELVVGMVVISIAFVLLSTMLFPQADRAAETLHRVRSAELAHSVMNEIWGKRFDENTNANGGVPACGAAPRADLGLVKGEDCTVKDKLGPDAESRNNFDDVDDYHGLDQGDLILNAVKTTGPDADTYASRYPNYKLSVTVTYPHYPSLNTKLITVTVTTPSNEAIIYNALRSNY